jgi:tRNA (adenine22-N1)-methyltransferase
MVVLSKRLMQIADKVLKGSRLADIGSDHALLPVYLCEQKQIASAVAGELNSGPYEAAKRQVVDANLSHCIEVRQGDGLEVIRSGEADVITIAGMGGLLIVQILTNGLSKLEHVKRLVLQPNVGEEVVRRWLVEQGWFLSEEYILQEDGKIYVVLVADHSEQAENLNQALYQPKLVGDIWIRSELQFAMGPYLLVEADSVWVNKWEEELNKLHRIVEQLAQSRQEASLQRQKQIEIEIREMKEVIACSLKAKLSFK